MTDGTDFLPGDIVLDRDTDEESPAYVTTLPDAPIEDWVAYEDDGEEITVAKRTILTIQPTRL
jgi:hypothetical protein